MSKINYKLKFPSSTYAATILDKKMYVGGSDWDRKKILYSKKIAEKSKGILYILKKTKGNFETEKTITFPSMIYSIIPLSKNNLFVACKGEMGTFNIISSAGKILKQKNDPSGKGVYNALLTEDEIILTTRTGKLEIINSKNLKVKQKKQISSPQTRLWSLRYDPKNKKIFLGDYNGVLYVWDKKNKLEKINLKKFYPSKNNFGPSLWGLELMGNKIITGNRWGDMFIFDQNLHKEEKINIGEDITCLEKISKQELLIGTRLGKLFSWNFKDKKLNLIIEIKPELQKENAVWGMTNINKQVLVCFADGYICNVSKK